jgi:hypothetical protein
MENLKSSSLYSKEDLYRLERQATLLNAMQLSKKKRIEKRNFKIALGISYFVLIWILGSLFYLAFVVLDIPKIQIFNF